METTVKGTIGAVTGVIAYLAGCLNELVIILVLLMILDYATGVIAAFARKDLASWKGVVGILKKVSFMLLVTLGFLLDFVISYLMQEKAGTAFSTGGMFGIATTLWLIGTEGMSIIENLGVIGVPIPKFLKPAFSKLKNQAEKVGGKNG